MQKNPLKQGILTLHSEGVGLVTRKMVLSRAVEIAITDGRARHEVSISDWQQAKRELTGLPDADPKEAMLESVPESERWDPTPGSEGRKLEVVAGEDEDAEGRSDNENLVAEGMEEAKRDQENQSAAGQKE